MLEATQISTKGPWIEADLPQIEEYNQTPKRNKGWQRPSNHHYPQPNSEPPKNATPMIQIRRHID